MHQIWCEMCGDWLVSFGKNSVYNATLPLYDEQHQNSEILTKD